MININNIKFSSDGLAPCIVQDCSTRVVLMMGYMNKEAIEKTLETSQVTFFSRSKQRLWTKGETSGNFLQVKEIFLDCDADTILIQAHATGPVCHTGQDTCFDQKNSPEFLFELEKLSKTGKLALSKVRTLINC